ncbi:hypothetical protein [Mycoplasmoides genitalium]|uniref:hypothetical protein n=1 Tax=Mycoplasmoides genitalium TaxID=2097 RepID=UPI000311A6A9|nr:hypothetical protein [Mycoplasmoides genitalium]
MQSGSPESDSSKTGEKLSEATSSMSSGATSTRAKALKIEVEKKTTLPKSRCSIRTVVGQRWS